MLSIEQPSPRYIETPEQQQKLESYSKIKWYTWPHLKVGIYTSPRGDKVSLKLPTSYDRGGSALQTCVSNEIISIPMTERNAKLAAAADGYLLSNRQETINIPFVFGPLLFPDPQAIKSIMDVRNTKKLMKSILITNNFQFDILKKIDFSKMKLQPRKLTIRSVMRYGLATMALPINTRKTRDHLKKVFASYNECLSKLDKILLDRTNYNQCPYIEGTEDGQLKESGWREILKLCIQPGATSELPAPCTETTPLLSAQS